MAEVRNRIKRQISDATEDSLRTSDSEEESSEGYDRSGARASTKTNMARPSRRSAGAANGTTSATISRSTSGSPDDRRQSIRLTVKAPPSKLREVMRVNEVDALKDVIGGGRIVEGPRRSRNVAPPRASGRRPDKPRYAEYGESDLEDDDDEEEDEDDEQEDEEDADEDEPMQDAVSDQDEEDEDQDMEDEPSPPKKSAPPKKPPKITLKQPNSTNGKAPANPKLIVTPAQVGPVKTVEEQEMEDDDEDDEEEEASSELSEDEEEDEEEEEEDDEQEETMQLNAGAALGASDMLGDDEELDEEDEDLESDDETPGSGTATPDVTKMTKRQRGRPEDSTELMALDMAPQQRKFFTDQEKAMKKDEHARKRKELTKRKIQEEKAAALNRLLKPQAHKARGAAPRPETLAAAAAAAAGSPYYEEEYQEKANPLYTRWVCTKDGIKLGVPEEWLGKRVGRVFGPPLPPSNGVLIQEL